MLSKDWQLSPIVTRRSGGVLNITDGGQDISGTAQGNDRPNQVGAAYPASKTTSQWFNPASFAKQVAGTYGNVGRNALYGPSAVTFDLSLSRTFPIKERYGFLFRVDAFNLLNHPIWGNPATSITSSQFGQITSFGAPRILQLGSKLTF